MSASFLFRAGRILAALLGFSIFLGGVEAGGADPSRFSLEDLAFMAGHWKSGGDGPLQEEIWMEPAGRIMPGLHRDVFSPEKSFFEYLRIEQTEAGIAYLASPRGAPPTPFRLTEVEEGFAAFTNPEHDFPQRIEYRLEGEQLCARIEGPGKDGATRSSRWCWERVR